MQGKPRTVELEWRDFSEEREANAEFIEKTAYDKAVDTLMWYARLPENVVAIKILKELGEL